MPLQPTNITKFTDTGVIYEDSFSALLCNEPFWDHSRAWDASVPQFGSCFERTVMVWIPCGFLLLYAPFYVTFLRRRPVNPIPWTALSYTKLVLSFMLIGTGLIELFWVSWQGSTSSIANFIAPAILLLTYATHIGLVCLGRLRGERTSGFLWLFWFVMLLCGIPQLITSFISVIYMTGEFPPVLVMTFIIQYLVTLSVFLTNWFADAPSKLQALIMSQKPSPELSASIPSQFMYWWSMPLIWTGWKRPLVFEDLWDINPDSVASVISDGWHADFDKKPKYSKDSYDTGKELGRKKSFLYRRLWRLCKGHLPLLVCFYFTAEMIRFITPQLLSLLIKFINNSEEPSWHGYIYAVSILLVCEASSLLKHHYFFNAVNVAVKIRSAIMSAVYKKALSLSGSSRREFTTGQIVNMMAVDAQIIGDTAWQMLSVIFAPIIILTAMGFLWVKLGPSVLAGLVVLILLTPVNSYLANRTKECQFEAIKLRDKRVKMATEIVGGIKVLKLYAWEESFAKEIQKVRDEEVSYFREVAYLQAFSGFVFNVSPYLVSLATFTTFLLVSTDNVLNAELAFVSIALFNIMKIPIIQMPSVVAQIIQSTVALRRIKKFLSGSEVDLSAVSSDRHEGAHLAIHGGQFSWESSEESMWSLRDIQLKIRRGKLVAVVGSVGAGKSSLISALLGEIRKDAGKVVVNGSIAYVPQQAWLQNATLRDNITWGQAYSEKWYKKVLEACALLPDLEMLDGGDMTEVGEKGINLSGGQKQRISLARAVYRDADILLLDDPLSAVDAHVGKHIFEKVIGPQGLLKSKTRLLVTHAVTFLPQVDEVIVLKDGRLVESGSYSELIDNDGDFAQFIVQYLTSCNDGTVDEEFMEIRSQLETAPRGELLRHISQISSTGSNTTITSKPASRPRSVSECVEDRDTKIQYISNLHLDMNNGDIPLYHDSKTPLRHVGNGTLPRSRLGSQKLFSSKMSIYSKASSLSSFGNVDAKAPDQQNAEKIHTLVDEELQETGKVARYVYLVYIRAMGWMFAITPFISLALGQACVAGGNVWLSLWSTAGDAEGNATLEGNVTGIGSQEGNSGVIGRDLFLTGYGLFGLGQAICIFGGQVFVMLGCLRAGNTLHKNLLSSVIRLPMSFFDTNPSGRIINRFSKETSALDFNLPNIVRSLLSCFTQVVATLLVIMISTPVASVVLIPIMVVYYLIQVVYVATSRQIKRIESVAKSPIYSHFSESISGVSVIRAFKKQNEFIQESLSKIDQFLKAVSFNVSSNRWVAVHLEAIGNIITFSAAMLSVLGRETISPGVVGLSVTYALNITMVLNWLVRIASDLEANIVSVERINEYIQKEQEAEWKIKEREPPASWPELGSICFQDYETRYRPGLDLVLKGISCSFQPSEKVGIVGRTGAGKSSLTLALFRIIESSGGCISIDDVRISDIGLHDLRSRLSIIPQDPVLFSGTLRLNLDPFETHSDAEVWRALELSHLKEYVKAQPSGLQHTVDEDGSNFSVGQRQLVCLARALLRQSKVLVLDEATAAVDLETDDFIQTTIREQFKDSTVLTIAHRINTILDYDRVLVLDQGKIAEFDTPTNLLSQSSSIFHGMAKDAGIIS